MTNATIAGRAARQPNVHPEFTDATRMLVSYDVNTFNARELLTNVDSYRPRFLRVKIGGH